MLFKLVNCALTVTHSNTDYLHTPPKSCPKDRTIHMGEVMPQRYDRNYSLLLKGRDTKEDEYTPGCIFLPCVWDATDCSPIFWLLFPEHGTRKKFFLILRVRKWTPSPPGQARPLVTTSVETPLWCFFIFVTVLVLTAVQLPVSLLFASSTFHRVTGLWNGPFFGISPLDFVSVNYSTKNSP